MHHDVWAEIDLNSIQQNLATIKEALLPDTGVIAVVKSNAYGHGLVEVAKALEDAEADMFAVTSIEEAVTLRQSGITKPILNLSYTAETDVALAIEKKISVTIYDSNSASILHEAASKLKKPLRIHIKIDTGMSRLGIHVDEALSDVPKIMQMPYFRVDGIYSHFADEDDTRFVQQQYEVMQRFLFSLQQQGFLVPAVHMAKSGVLFQSKDYHFEAVRPGLALYGYGPQGHNLQPALSFKTVLAQVKKIPKGSSVGYMQTFKADRDMTIGILPVGYAHGYDRGLSNKGHVLVDGYKCPVIGRVCMALTIIDLTPVPTRLTIGEEVVLVGEQKKAEITVKDLADLLETNTYEVVTRIPSSVHRVYHGEH